MEMMQSSWRARLIYGVLLVFGASALETQATETSSELRLGATQKKVEAKYGKPFERARITDDDYSAQVGVPKGLWTVYHLTQNSRLYVTMLHFGPGSKEKTAEPELDAVMLELTDHWSIKQILTDQSLLKTVCVSGCQILRSTNRVGNQIVLLKPLVTTVSGPIIDFEGDSATISFKSVESLESSPSWVYMIRAEDFESHHAGLQTELIGTWDPSVI